MDDNIDFPNLIIFYGPPGSGKGTQANLLAKKFGAEFLDAGHQFRQFVRDYQDLTDHKDYVRSLRVKEYLDKGKPILTEDFLYIIKEKVEKSCVKKKETLIMDKPGGSLIPEAEWMDDLIKENKIKTAFIHLLLPLEIAIERATNRWYAPNSKNSYLSYNEAKNHCKNGEEPTQRGDDKDISLIKTRYDKLYGQNHKRILEIFGVNSNVDLTEIDSTLAIDEVQSEVLSFLIK